jgi:methanogenic corrinoid protein MtbC1
VKGDIHEIGKNIFKAIAEGSGFDMRDIGVDVDPSTFIHEIVSTKPHVIALSCLLTTSFGEMRNTVSALTTAKVRDNLKIILGGNAVTRSFADEIGADASATDAVQGVKFCKGVIKT